MHRAARLGRVLFALALCLVLASAAIAGQSDDQDDSDGDAGSYRRETPSSRYVDPASFFRFHGYVTLVLAEAGVELGTEPFSTPQILVSGISPRTGENPSGFTNDAALFVGGEPLEGVGTVIELHLVGQALDPVLTEAKVSWEMVGDETTRFALRLVGGRFWWGFGIHNEEWFSAINRFSMISPAAAEVVPAHYNEVGLMAEGELQLSGRYGLNYSFSVGNGVPSFELADNVGKTGFDQNSGRTLTGTTELVFRGRSNRTYAVGFSASGGELRSTADEVIAPEDPRRYAADFNAVGLHGLIRSETGLGLRAYFYGAGETLSDAPIADIDRRGFTVEPDYAFRPDLDALGAVSLFARYSMADETNGAGELRRIQYGGGVELMVKQNLKLRFAYLLQNEAKDARKLDNDIFTFGFTAEF